MGSECYAYPIVAEESDDVLQRCALFRLCFQIDDAKIGVKQYSVWAATDRMGVKLVTDLLVDMCIPPEPLLVTTILDCARHMIADHSFNKKKILNMFVAIHLPASAHLVY